MSIGYIASGWIGNRVASISSCIYDSQYKNINLTENMIHLMKENKKNWGQIIVVINEPSRRKQKTEIQKIKKIFPSSSRVDESV